MNFEQSEDVEKMIEAFNGRQEKAYDFFFRKYYAALCLFANSYLKDQEQAKDIVQECFIKIWNKQLILDEFKNIQSFLYTVVRNSCIEKIRRDKVIHKKKDQYDYLNGIWDKEEIDEVIHAELIRKIHAEISILPPKMKKVFILYYLEGKKLSEIATEMNSAYDTVRQQRTRALKLLKGRLLIILTLIDILKNIKSN